MLDGASLLELSSPLHAAAAALALSVRLRNAESAIRSLSALLDELESAVILVDPDHRPEFINRGASHILALRDGLVVAPDGLATAAAATTSALRAVITDVAARARCESAGASVRRLLVTRPSSRPPWLLSIVPVSPHGDGLTGASAGHAAILITECDAERRIDSRSVADCFLLTNREAAVAALLATGLSPKGIGRALGIGVGTVRTHLKHVFEKTGARSQTALALRLQSFAFRAPRLPD